MRMMDFYSNDRELGPKAELKNAIFRIFMKYRKMEFLANNRKLESKFVKKSIFQSVLNITYGILSTLAKGSNGD